MSQEPPSSAPNTAGVRRLVPADYPAAARLCADALLQRARLDPRFPAPAPDVAYRTLLASLHGRLKDPDAAAFALVADGRLIGTLAAAFRRVPESSSERLYSPLAGAWLPQSLCAVAADQAPIAVLGPLYAAAADWLAGRGIGLHFATDAAADGLGLVAWQTLGFRVQGVFALLPAGARQALATRAVPAGIAIGPARRSDAAAIVALLAESHRYHAHLSGSFFAPDDGDRHYPSLVRAELRAASGEPHYLLAWDGDTAVGLVSGYVERAPAEVLAAITRPLPLGYIAEVAVTEQARGRGLAGALIAALLPWFAQRGAEHVGLHYIANNPTAARAWPALGFVPLEVRLQGGPDASKLGLAEALPL